MVPGEPEAPLARGTVIDDRFVVEEPLGRGGMGYVLAARHRELDERVAIKLLLPDKADAAARKRMLREAQNAVKIKSEHSVRIMDVVSTGAYAPYIVMELLCGESLAERLARDGPLAVEDAVEIVAQAAEAVGEAHQYQIVHRDLKPSNLYLLEKPGHPSPAFVKVLDFGVSKRVDAEPGHELTQTSALVGSPVYAPPEQLRASHAVDHRADIWALGVILYQALTQKLPFRGATLAEVCTRILQDPPPSPRALRPEIPPFLDTAILRCLEKEPARRFGSVAELVLALRELAPGAATRTLIYLDALRAASGAEAARAVERPIEPERDATLSPSTLGEPRPVRTARRGVWVAFAGGLIALSAAAWLRHTRSAPSTAAMPAQPMRALPATASAAAPTAEPSGNPATLPQTAPNHVAKRRAPAVKRRPATGSQQPPWVDSR